MGLGIANKFLEAWSGAVLAKIALLVFIIVLSRSARKACSRSRAGWLMYEPRVIARRMNAALLPQVAVEFTRSLMRRGDRC
jgi:hypothetical protein